MTLNQLPKDRMHNVHPPPHYVNGTATGCHRKILRPFSFAPLPFDRLAYNRSRLDVRLLFGSIIYPDIRIVNRFFL
jgi:hypothetical protein